MKVKCSRRVRNYRIFLWVLLCGCIMTIALIMLSDIYQSVPNTIYLKSGEETQLSFSVPLSGTIKLRGQTESDDIHVEAAESEKDQEVLSGDARATGINAAQEVLSDDIRVDFSEDVRLTAATENKYYVNLKLFGIIPFKTVNIEVIRDSMVYPAGVPIGIYVKTNGILVIGVSNFKNQNGDPVMPSEHLLQVGDYIQAVNGEQIDEKSTFVSLVAESEGKPMVMTIERSGESFDVGVKPQKDEAGEYKLGIWVKDSAQGIGTLTYVDTNGSFGALGHGVSDTDTGIMLEMSEGALYRTDIIGITKGLSGTPGELTGVIRYTESNCIGVISDNQAVGIHGSAGAALLGELTAEPVEIGLKQEVKLGKAYIYCLLEDQADYYEIELTSMDYDSVNVNKEISIRVTDSRLLSLTGGIVQGMSGSPILQNGKLIGAVTHVLVNDPTRGYGIFIENMLEE